MLRRWSTDTKNKSKTENSSHLEKLKSYDISITV